MSKTIKQLAIIYTAALVSGVFAITYVSSGIDALTRTAVTPQDTASYSTYELQKADAGEQPAAISPQSDNIGGNGQNFELQPALGYAAYNVVTQ